MQKIIRNLIAAAATFVAAPAMAVTLSISPAAQTQTLGTPISIDILIADLGDFSSPSLGSFDIFVSYDASILTPTQADYGTQLNQGDTVFGSDQAGLVLESGPTPECSAANCFEVAEFSFLTDQELNDGQPADFLLAAITFTSQVVGTSPLVFEFVELGDELGDEILNATLQSASVTIEAAPTTQVPLPASLLLLGSLLFWRRR